VANLYVRSTDGNNSDNGSTWALAKQTLAGAASAAAAGDTIFVSQAHNYSAINGGGTFPGTFSAPCKIICGNDGLEPPTVTALTGKETATSAVNVTLAGNIYCYGLVLENSSTSSGAVVGYGVGDNNVQVIEKNTSILSANSTNPRVVFGGSSVSYKGSITCIDHTFKFGNAGQGLTIYPAYRITFIDGGIDATSSAITNLIRGTLTGEVDFKAIGVNLSAAASSFNIVEAPGGATGSVLLRGCKMPSSWSGALCGSDPTSPGFRASMYHCDSADTHYRVLIHTAAGTIRDETTLVKTGGAEIEGQAISWKMTTGANANRLVNPLISDDIAIPNSTVGSSVTVSIDILHDSATNLKDDEVWLELDYFGTSGVPLLTTMKDKPGILATPADQTASSATWTTTGMSNPNKQKLEVTFTPQEVGAIRARICLGKASKTIYADFKPTVT
jgi:hypothetical protein